MRIAEKASKSLLVIPALMLALLSASCTETDTQSPPTQQAPTIVKVGAGAPAGIYDDLVRNITRIVNEHEETTGIELESVTSAGSIANLNALAAGEIQFGIAQADDQFNAVNGLGKWSASGPQQDLRSIAGIYYELVTLVAGGDSGILTVADLKGKRVDIGLPGTGTRQNAIDALKAAGIDWQTDIQISEMDVDDRLTAFMQGELDAFFFTIGHPSLEVKFATFSQRQARLISLDGIDNLITEFPYYSIQAIPLGRYPRALNKESTQTVGVRATFVTSANVPDDVVYKVTKTAFENAEKFRVYFPEFAELRGGDKDIFAGLTAPIHPGALRYFEEAGISTP
jgi:TRAP transporter TAXI family solute receptor